MNESMDELKFETVNRKTLAKQVIERIVHLLSSGQLKAGDKLPTEMELMDILSVSRPVLREALSSLETLGVITRKTRGGTYFNDKISNQPFSVMLALAQDNLPAILEARMVLELGLVTIAAEKISEEELKKLEKTIEMIKESTDNNYGEADKEFHRIIALSANNPVVEGMIQALLVSHAKIDSQIPYREKNVTVNYHQKIYEALQLRDPYQAHFHMHEHLKFVRDKILKGLNQTP
ncbi:FadR family transcriptional regulator [Bacillus sp. JZ35]|nr:FadR/GntR family transcriptional regulator [Bacillus safensis]PNU23851.1 FadR family transcriptional regulator [Bacillus stratosphericus]APJ10286.1 GntR family transcriptional regulator [Bacillus safensis]MED4592783.1 FadR/GntR family transcriptional regulator [Bacillus safensis]MED4638694.1 FadR/GntR family transcriptional regulator [Bacillus safensis]VCT96012.1 HTH-type transcriptional regulator LutR [Bacillus safensis]